MGVCFMASPIYTSILFQVTKFIDLFIKFLLFFCVLLLFDLCKLTLQRKAHSSS